MALPSAAACARASKSFQAADVTLGHAQQVSNKVLEIIEDEGVPPKVFNGIQM